MPDTKDSHETLANLDQLDDPEGQGRGPRYRRSVPVAAAAGAVIGFAAGTLGDAGIKVAQRAIVDAVDRASSPSKPVDPRAGVYIVLREDGTRTRVVVEPDIERGQVVWFAVREGDHLARYDDGRRLVRCFASGGPYDALSAYVSSHSSGCTPGHAIVEWWRDGEKSRAELLADISQLRERIKTPRL